MLIIEPPINEKWMLLNPPGSLEKRYHFVKLNRQGRMYSPFSGVNHLFFSTAVANFRAYRADVFAPESATVKTVVTGKFNKLRFNFFIDLIGKSKIDVLDRSTWGNFVILEMKNGKQLVLKHLHSVSDLVAGQQVEKGHVLGKTGSSGKCHLPGLGLLCFTDDSFESLDRLAFLGVKDKQGVVHDMFYPIQAKSFRKKEEEKPAND